MAASKKQSKSLMRNLGEFFGHIVKGVKSDPRNNPAKRKQVVRKDVEEEQRGNITLRRTTIEEIEFSNNSANAEAPFHSYASRRTNRSPLSARIATLVEDFPEFLRLFSDDPAFRRREQLTLHQETIRLRREAGSIEVALKNDSYLNSLYRTLQAWGIGMRASKLVPPNEFLAIVRNCRIHLSALEQLNLAELTRPVADVADDLWELISAIRFVDNSATLVPTTKAIHHLLPDLVVPIDRRYTQSFFGWHNPQFQIKQHACFIQSFNAFAQIAAETDPAKYVGSGWNTSVTKVIDNAIIGAVRHWEDK